jgi:glycosyltransferase involved in cell wall biosynthesis
MSSEHTVSVIVPCRNERDFIEAFCRSVAAQAIPDGWTLEVLIADGMSDDCTRERLTALCMQDTRFVMLDNPGRIVSCGLNRCIERAQGAFIVRLDVHTVYATDYIAQCLAAWQRTGADNVGGAWKAQGTDGPQGTVQRAIAAAVLVPGGIEDDHRRVIALPAHLHHGRQQLGQEVVAGQLAVDPVDLAEVQTQYFRLRAAGPQFATARKNVLASERKRLPTR